jgi:hypothetical protein
MNLRVLSLVVVTTIIAGMSTPAVALYPDFAQYLGQCSAEPTRAKKDLEASIQTYQEHIDRLSEKFVTGFYGQADVRHRAGQIDLSQVVTSLAELAPRRTALLFYAFAYRNTAGLRTDTLCAWLISPYIEVGDPNPNFLNEQVAIRLEGLEDLRANIVSALGVIGLARSTLPTEPRHALKEAARVLLPQTFVSALEKNNIDTLVVLPTFDVGAIPFEALPIDEYHSLIDIVSVVVAPGFFVFLSPPGYARADFSRTLVAADPGSAPSAEEGAQAIADALINATTVIPVSRKTIQSLVTAKPGPSLIYIAAHSRADDVNPLDGSYLQLSDGPWTAKEIAQLDLRESRPLVVLSACETGLGRNFEVGNIGLARAWYQAGASNVIMSLWRVHQVSTQSLMSRLMTLLPRCPPDRALRAAMQRERANPSQDAAQWAGFSVFGSPERPTTPDWRCDGDAP